MKKHVNALCFGGGGLVGTVKALGHLVGLDQLIRGPEDGPLPQPCFFDYMERAGVPLRQLERRIDEVFRIMPGEVLRGERDKVRRHFRVASGISGGSLLATAVTGGIPLVELVRESVTFPVVNAYFRPDLKEYGRALRHLPKVPSRVAATLLREFGGRPEWPRHLGRLFLPSLDDLSRISFELLSSLEDCLPRGIFSGVGIEQYVHRLGQRHGLQPNFKSVRESGRWLFIIAERFNSVRPLSNRSEPETVIYFGMPPYDTVPIARAIRASCSIPGITTPLEFHDASRDRDYLLADGAIGKTIGRRKVTEAVPTDLVVAVNPIVPFDGPLNNMLDILEQTYRKLIYSRLKGVEAHLDDEQRNRTIHIESRPDAFFYNMLRVDKMRAGLYEGYYQTLLAFDEHYDEWAERLRSGGLGLLPRATVSELLGKAALVRDREYLREDRQYIAGLSAAGEPRAESGVGEDSAEAAGGATSSSAPEGVPQRLSSPADVVASVLGRRNGEANRA